MFTLADCCGLLPPLADGRDSAPASRSAEGMRATLRGNGGAVRDLWRLTDPAQVADLLAQAAGSGAERSAVVKFQRPMASYWGRVRPLSWRAWAQWQRVGGGYPREGTWEQGQAASFWPDMGAGGASVKTLRWPEGAQRAALPMRLPLRGCCSAGFRLPGA